MAQPASQPASPSSPPTLLSSEDASDGLHLLPARPNHILRVLQGLNSLVAQQLQVARRAGSLRRCARLLHIAPALHHTHYIALHAQQEACHCVLGYGSTLCAAVAPNPAPPNPTQPNPAAQFTPLCRCGWGAQTAQRGFRPWWMHSRPSVSAWAHGFSLCLLNGLLQELSCGVIACWEL